MDMTINKSYLTKEEHVLRDGALSPLILQRADPYIIKHNNLYYFTASVPEYDRIEISCSDTLDGLRQATPKVIWRKHENGLQSEHIWAPEMHLIDGKWHIYYAASERDNKWELRPYVLRCEGSDPLYDEWIELGAVKGLENDDAFSDFSLDATVFFHNDKKYLIWAEKVGRQFGISNLYIAELDTPTQLKTKRVLISSPTLAWETIDFSVNEGAFVIKNNGKIYVMFSASATGAMYCMGLLYMDENKDPLNTSSWTKVQEPIFETNRTLGIYGPGHNCITYDENDNPLCVFHARPYESIQGDPLYDPNRHTYIVRFEFDSDGRPVFFRRN